MIIHISGPTASGKTALGYKIKKKYQTVIIKDLDDFMRDNPHKTIKNFIKWQDNKIKSFIKKNSNDIIVFVGVNSISFNKDFSDPVYYDVYADEKFFIMIDTNVILRRRFERHIDFMKDNTDKYFNKALKRGSLVIDLELWKEKINSTQKSSYYDEHNYSKLNNDKILKKVLKLIKNN